MDLQVPAVTFARTAAAAPSEGRGGQDLQHPHHDGGQSVPASSPPPPFWELHHRVGTVDLSATGRMLVSVVRRGGEWYVRLYPERLVARASGSQWAPANHTLLLPLSALPALEAYFAEARAFLQSSPRDQSLCLDIAGCETDTPQS